MRSLRWSTIAATNIVGVSLVLSGCSGGTTGLPSAAIGPQSLAMRGAVAPLAKAAHGVYVVTGTPSGQYVINEYALNDSGNGAPICSINAGTSIFPGDLATDKKGNLWVPTIATPSISSVWEVVEYAPGCGAPGKALADSGVGQPSGVAFDSKGNTYVANEVNGSFGPGNVAVYRPGKTAPSKILTSPLIGAFVSAIAIDAADDVYVSCDTSSLRTQVVEFKNGKGTGTAVNVSGFSVISGITFDKHQNMILTDYSLVQDEVYAPPYSGAPTATIPLASGSSPLFSKLNKSNNVLYVTGTTGLNVYSYPAGTFKYAVTNGIGRGGAGGLAIDPASRR